MQFKLYLIYTFCFFQMNWSNFFQSGQVDLDKEAERDFVEKKLKLQKIRAKRKGERQKHFRESVFPIKVKVTRVDIEGVDRTSPELLKETVKSLLECKTYGDLVLGTKLVHKNLKTLGCFKNVDIFLDSEVKGKTEDIRVTVTVVEMNRVGLDIQPVTSNLNLMLCKLSLDFTNLFRNGESLRAETYLRPSLQHNGRLHDLDLKFAKGLISSLFGYVTWVTSLSNSNWDLTWRDLKSHQYSISTSLIVQPLSWLENKLSLSSSVVHLRPLVKSIAFNPRTECGYSLKSSLSHILTIDTRDDIVLPNRGFYLKWLNELSSNHSTGNQSGFMRHDLLSSIHIPFGTSTSFAISFRAAQLVMPWRGVISSSSSDHAWFLNPIQCRGWDLNLCKEIDVLNKPGSLLAASGKLNFPIPFFRGNNSSWILKNTRTHLFCDFGQMGFPNPSLSSLSVGLGMAIRLGQFGRAELNFCQSLYDRNSRNLRFGMGVDFL